MGPSQGQVTASVLNIVPKASIYRNIDISLHCIERVLPLHPNGIPVFFVAVTERNFNIPHLGQIV